MLGFGIAVALLFQLANSVYESAEGEDKFGLEFAFVSLLAVRGYGSDDMRRNWMGEGSEEYTVCFGTGISTVISYLNRRE